MNAHVEWKRVGKDLVVHGSIGKVREGSIFVMVEKELRCGHPVYSNDPVGLRMEKATKDGRYSRMGLPA